MKAPNQLKCFWTIGLRWSGHSYDHFVSKLQSGMFWRTLNLLFFVWRLLWERGGKEGKGKGKRLEPVTWALCADMQRRWPFSTPGLKISSLALIFFSFSFSQMTLFLFWCRSFFCELVPIQFRWPAGLCVSENGLAVFSSNCSAHSGLQLGKALHWSWVRDICFIHTGGSFEDCAACRGSLLLFGCLIIF